MRFRTTIILAILAAALAAFYVVFDLLPSTRLATTEELRAEGQFVFSGSPFGSGEGAGRVRLRDLVSRLTIERGSEKIVFERVVQPPATKWRMREPIQTDAASGETGLLCYELESLKIKSAIRPAQSPEGGEVPLDLAAFGLDHPRVRVTFTVEKPGEPATSWSLLTGKTDADGQALYVKREDQNVVYAVTPAIMERLSESVNELRDTVVMPINPEEIAAVEIIGAAPPSVVRCELGKGGWFIVKPITDHADEGRINELLNAAIRLRVKPDDFISESDSGLAKYGLDKPHVTFSVQQEGGVLSLLLGAEVEGKAKVYAKRSDRPTIFALDKRDADGFKLKPSDVRSLSALRFNADEVAAVDLDLPTGKVTVRKSDDAWRIEAPVTLAADAAEVKEFLAALERLQIISWVDDEKPDLSQYGLAIPLASVTLTMRAGAKATLRLGTPMPEGVAYAQRGDSGPLMKLKRDILDRLAPGHLAFIDKRLHIADGTITAISIARADGNYVCLQQKKVWRIDSPVKAPADQDTMRTIMWNSSFLSAARFVEQKPKDLATYGLDKPAIKLTVTAEKTAGDSKSAATRTLLVGKESGPDAFFGMVEGSDAVFTVAKEAVEPLQKSLFSRAVCEFDSSKAVSLIVEGPDVRVRVQKQAGPNDLRPSWAKMPPERGEAQSASVDAILAVIGSLTAERVVACSLDNAAQYGLDKPILAVTVGLPNRACKVTIGAKTEGGYFATGDGPLVYLLKAADVDKLMRQLTEAARP